MDQGGWGSSAGANSKELVRRESEGHGPVFYKRYELSVCACTCVHVCSRVRGYLCVWHVCMHALGWKHVHLESYVKGTRPLAVIPHRSGGGVSTATSVTFFFIAQAKNVTYLTK